MNSEATIQTSVAATQETDRVIILCRFDTGLFRVSEFIPSLGIHSVAPLPWLLFHASILYPATRRHSCRV